MDRHETVIRDGVLYVEVAEEGWLKIGPLDDICAVMGGEIYTIEYDDRHRQVSWLQTDEDGMLSFNLCSMPDAFSRRRNNLHRRGYIQVLPESESSSSDLLSERDGSGVM